MAKDKARTNDDAAQAATTEAANETYFSIPNAAAELGIEKQRLRALIRQEKIEGVTVEVIAGSEIERYKEARGNRGSSGKQGERKEGKLWVIRLTKEQHDAYLAGTLDTTTVPLEPRYTAQNKSKKKAADALTAEATAGASEGATDLPPGATHAEDDVWNASGDQSDETPSGDDIVYED
jgi:hypothetical protein